MIGVIPNPSKTITIELPCAKITEVMPLISILHPKYKETSSDDLLKLFVFEASEFLSLGVYIDITLEVLSETKTGVTVEVKRKIGAFDQAQEVRYGNEHISRIFELISKALKMNDGEINQLIHEKENSLPLTKEENNIKTNKMIFGIIIFILAAIGVYIKFHQ